MLYFFQSNLLAEWVPIKYESNKYDFFFDPSSKIKIDQRVNIWTLIQDKHKLHLHLKDQNHKQFYFPLNVN